MTSTALIERPTSEQFDIDPRAVTIVPILNVVGLGEPCHQCDDEDCHNEAQMSYVSLFTGEREVISGSNHCLALVYRSEADYENPTTIEVQR
jgi:hypothetical protein